MVHIWDRSQWNFRQVLLIYYYSTVFHLPVIAHKAARAFLRFGDITNHEIEDPSTRIASHCLHDLYIFRKKYLRLEFMEYEGSGCLDSDSCSKLWKRQAQPFFARGLMPSQEALCQFDACSICHLLVLEATSRMPGELERAVFDHFRGESCSVRTSS